jgi:hypothetical protein
MAHAPDCFFELVVETEEEDASPVVVGTWLDYDAASKAAAESPEELLGHDPKWVDSDHLPYYVKVIRRAFGMRCNATCTLILEMRWGLEYPSRSDDDDDPDYENPYWDCTSRRENTHLIEEVVP